MNDAEEQTWGTWTEKMADKCQFICGFINVRFHEFICKVCSQLCDFFFFRLILKGTCTSVFVRCALFTDSTKNKQR